MTLLDLRNVAYRYPDGTPALSDVSFRITSYNVCYTKLLRMIFHAAAYKHLPILQTQIREAVVSAGKVEGRATGQVENRDTFLRAINGLAFGSSRRQGMVRDNRFYHRNNFV